MIRVSVVATGIDQALAQRAPCAGCGIAARVTHARTDNQRMAERIERTERARSRLRPQLRARTSRRRRRVAPARMPATAPASRQRLDRKSAATAAICRRPGRGRHDPSAGAKALAVHRPAAARRMRRRSGEPEAFIPPQAERLPSRAPRMPRIDELPIPAQNEIRARRGELPQEEHPEGQRKSLLQRLASVGLGRRDQDEHEAERRAARRRCAPQAGRAARRAADAAHGAPKPRPEPVSEYAKRPAPQGLDQHGRQAPVHNPSEEDQLDIPAFLRRQAN